MFSYQVVSRPAGYYWLHIDSPSGGTDRSTVPELKIQYKREEFDMSKLHAIEILLYAALLSLLVGRGLLDLVSEQATTKLRSRRTAFRRSSGRTSSSSSMSSVSISATYRHHWWSDWPKTEGTHLIRSSYSKESTFSGTLLLTTCSSNERVTYQIWFNRLSVIYSNLPIRCRRCGLPHKTGLAPALV